MTWLVASIPFWLLGGISFLVGLVGFWSTLRAPGSPDQALSEFYAFCQLLLFAGAMLWIAARLVS